MKHVLIRSVYTRTLILRLQRRWFRQIGQCNQYASLTINVFFQSVT